VNLPDGYLAIDAFPAAEKPVSRVCLVVRQEPDPADGPLVLLRTLADARVYLGCLVDARDRVHQWLELWFQEVDRVQAGLSPSVGALSNASLDGRWTRYVEALEQVHPGTLVRTGAETANPSPLVLDPEAGTSAYLSHPASGDPLELCRDEAVLAAKGLPGYEASLHRYLYVPALAGRSPFVPVTADAPTTKATVSLDDLFKDGPGGVPVNLSAGRMLVRSHPPVAFEALVDLLGGAGWDRLASARALPELVAADEEAPPEEADLHPAGWLFVGRGGPDGRLGEVCHLKLRLLAEAFALVRAVVRRTQRPMLSLSPESFRVRMDRPARGLPLLWTAAPVLVDPGDAVALTVEGTDARYFVPAGRPAMSIYRPEAVGSIVRGTGFVRIRRIVDESPEALVVEGTLATQDTVRPTGGHLLWLRLTLDGAAVDLYGHPAEDAALAAGEFRFRTVPQALGEEAASAVCRAEGVPLPATAFEILPLLATPCDLYSLGVLGVRTLLVDEETSLAIALDEMFSLANQAAAEYDAAVPLEDRIRTIAERDAKWLEALGPQRLGREPLTPEQALTRVPPDLWYRALAILVRCFPGVGPDSLCRDWGDAPAGALHRVFDEGLEALGRLLAASRSLIVVDWTFHREVRAVIRRFLDDLEQDEPDG